MSFEGLPLTLQTCQPEIAKTGDPGTEPGTNKSRSVKALPLRGKIITFWLTTVPTAAVAVVESSVILSVQSESGHLLHRAPAQARIRQVIADFRLSIGRKTKFENRKWKLAKAEVGPIFQFRVSTLRVNRQSAICN